MSWIQEFKTFALKGSMVDLAIGVIIGAVFGKVINSLVTDIIMPPLGLLIGGVDFASLSLKMHLPSSSLPPVEWKYGAFLNVVIEFLIVATAIFLLVKVMNRLRNSKAEATTKECPDCCMQIPIKAKKCCHCCSPLNP